MCVFPPCLLQNFHLTKWNGCSLIWETTFSNFYQNREMLGSSGAEVLVGFCFFPPCSFRGRKIMLGWSTDCHCERVSISSKTWWRWWWPEWWWWLMTVMAMITHIQEECLACQPSAWLKTHLYRSIRSHGLDRNRWSRYKEKIDAQHDHVSIDTLRRIMYRVHYKGILPDVAYLLCVLLWMHYWILHLRADTRRQSLEKKSNDHI